ncbi:MAG TPA: hypothetical protein VIN40_10850 [Candidatus Tyrphobacter sp.]
MKQFAAFTISAAFALSVAAIGIARADLPMTHYNIAIWNPITHAYPVTGSMDLRFHPDGVVDGYYHPAGLPSFIPISGGRTGDHIWLTIGLHGGWQLNGSFQGAKIVGSAVDQAPGEDRNIGKFGAPIALSDAAPMYSFTATPF